MDKSKLPDSFELFGGTLLLILPFWLFGWSVDAFKSIGVYGGCILTLYLAGKYDKWRSS